MSCELVMPAEQLPLVPLKPNERLTDRVLNRSLDHLATSSDRIFESHVRIAAQEYATSLGVPTHFIEMLLIIEDKRFALHFGIDPCSQVRAALKNMRRHRRVQGASTITQQLYDIRRMRSNVHYVRQRSMRRKIRQAAWAVRCELTTEKADILKEYLENVYWGRNYIGLEAASFGYFNHSKRSLSLAESFFLTAKLGSPNTESPTRVESLLGRSGVRGLLARDDSSRETLRQLYRYQILKEGS